MKAVPAYAGFFERFSAFCIDTGILTLVYMLINFALGFSPLGYVPYLAISLASFILIDALYEIVLTSRYGGTPGKLLMRLEVADESGKRISMQRSTGRYFARYITHLTVFVGYLIIVFDKRKQSLHDKIASTFVVRSMASKVPAALKKAAFALGIALFLGYVLYLAYAVGVGVYLGVAMHSNKIGEIDPAGDILRMCDSDMPLVRDSCMVQSLSGHQTLYLQDIGSFEAFCSHINDDDMYSSCMASLAAWYKDSSMCGGGRDAYARAVCKRQYDLKTGLNRLFNPAPKRMFNGTLVVDNVMTGVYEDGHAVLTGADTFSRQDTLVIAFRGVSGFKRADDGKAYYQIDLHIWDSQGALKSEEYSLYDEESEYLKIGGMIDEINIPLTLRYRQPGTYIYGVTIFDSLTKKSYQANTTINVVKEKTVGHLVASNASLGVGVAGRCLPWNHTEVTKDHSVCMTIDRVISFNKDALGHNWVQVDVGVADSTGKSVYYYVNTLDNGGEVDDINQFYWDFGPQIDLSDDAFSSGRSYTLTYYIRDRVSGNSANLSVPFTISPPGSLGILNISYMAVGTDYNVKSGTDTACYGSGSRKFREGTDADLCFEPMNVTGLSKDEFGINRFEVDLIITDLEGNVVKQGKDLLGGYGNRHLKNNMLNDDQGFIHYYAKTPIYEFKAGYYRYKITVRDLNSGRTGTADGSFEITEGFPQ